MLSISDGYENKSSLNMLEHDAGPQGKVRIIQLCHSGQAPQWLLLVCGWLLLVCGAGQLEVRAFPCPYPFPFPFSIIRSKEDSKFTADAGGCYD